MSLESQYEVTLRINGDDYGVWDSFSGGGVDSEETKYRPGGMAAQISLGGSKSTENITLGRLFRADRDNLIVKQLNSLCGNGDCVVVKQMLTVDGAATGEPLTYAGTLKSCKAPDHNSESDDPGMIELEISAAGLPA